MGALLLASLILALAATETCDDAGNCIKKKTKVILDHDGGVDDYLGPLLLLVNFQFPLYRTVFVLAPNFVMLI